MKYVNTIGVATLCKREIWRFTKVWNQTVLAPVVTTLLFLAIMTLALGGDTRMVEGIAFDRFIAPGLIMMAIVQNAFANTSSSLMLGKIQGVIIDLLTPPLTGAEITFSMVVGGVVRGFAVGTVVMVAVYMFVPFTLHHPLFAVLDVLMASIMLALFGVMAGLWSQSFDQLSAITNYVITPLAFLSGTFYSIQQLPAFWFMVCHYNPFFYMIDTFRYALTGISDGNPVQGLIVLACTNVVLALVCVRLLKTGYRLKS